jgi:hypothetical protein
MSMLAALRATMSALPIDKRLLFAAHGCRLGNARAKFLDLRLQLCLELRCLIGDFSVERRDVSDVDLLF